jgi:REP element-mobilizing transposase RayT
MPSFKRKNLRLQNFEYKGGYVYYVTICTHIKEPFFLNKQLAASAEKALAYYLEKKEINIYCHCIMPDHIHMLLTLGENYKKSLSSWVSSFKRYVLRESKQKLRISKLWQHNYYDHVIRSEESLFLVGEYILSNPVRKNIVDKWEDYPFSKLYSSDLKVTK